MPSKVGAGEPGFIPGHNKPALRGSWAFIYITAIRQYNFTLSSEFIIPLGRQTRYKEVLKVLLELREKLFHLRGLKR